MGLDRLHILHQRKRAGAADFAGAPGFFFLDSCQRRLWVTEDKLADGLELPEDVEHFSGTEAYQLLLRVATGLESQIAGETDIFGQLKQAWQSQRETHPSLEGLFQRLFEDTKDIRSRFLQNLGGASYGSLVRRLVRESGADGPVLIIGAGQLAHSVAPYLQEHELWLWNRTAGKLGALVAGLSDASRVRMLEGAEAELEAWSKAAHVVVCIPLDKAVDPARIASCRAATVIHLGANRGKCGEWTDLAGFRCLDDVFDLEKSQDKARSFQLAQAAKACQDRAKLRSLGNSVTIAHGWEDLAVFA